MANEKGFEKHRDISRLKPVVWWEGLKLAHGDDFHPQSRDHEYLWFLDEEAGSLDLLNVKHNGRWVWGIKLDAPHRTGKIEHERVLRYKVRGEKPVIVVPDPRDVYYKG